MQVDFTQIVTNGIFTVNYKHTQSEKEHNRLVNQANQALKDFIVFVWFKHILLITRHDKGIGESKKLCLALSMTYTDTSTHTSIHKLQ